MDTEKIHLAIIGVGGFARHHLIEILQHKDTVVRVLCEPNSENLARAEEVFSGYQVPFPQNVPDLNTLLAKFRRDLDVALIVSPHAFHFQQSVDCLEAGLDVLLEKPMVMNRKEASDLIDVRDKTGRLLVVAFPGSLSPQIRTAVHMFRTGQLGEILNISGTVWQNWGSATAGTWRQEPAISGGGFMFDTGAHMLNTMVDLAGEDFSEVSAWLDNSGRTVDTRCVMAGKLQSGALVTINGCGEAIPSCASDIRIFTRKAILYTGIYGEKLQIQYLGNNPAEDIPVPSSSGVWQQFLSVRNGENQNPCPPEVGLRMVKLWDAIRLSSSKNGIPVRLSS